MKKFISLSQYPGKTGQYYYTKFFQKYNLSYQYEPRGTINLENSIKQALDEKVSGISISMPFKKLVVDYLDVISPEVDNFNSCNTILVENNKLIGYNTDCAGAIATISLIDKTEKIAILGNGAMAQMFYQILRGYHVQLVARNLNNWETRYNNFDVYINCTALGTSLFDSPFEYLPECRLVIDLSIKDNQLSNQCERLGTKYFSGLEFYKYQFLKQFKIYTGLEIDAKEFGSV